MLNFVGLGRMSNFTLQDVAGSAVAVVVFALALYVPGYVLGYAANLFGFRQPAISAIAFPGRSRIPSR